MKCPECGKDLKEDKSKPSYVTKINEHFGEPYSTKGTYCGHCCRTTLTFVIPVATPFVRSGRRYVKLDELVEEFTKQVIEFYQTRESNQAELFDLEDFEIEDAEYEEPEE